MENKNKKLEGLIKDKLKDKGVSNSWMKAHLIIDVMDNDEEDEDYCEHCGELLEDCPGYKCWK